MSAKLLEGHTIIVTGAGGGLGQGTALALAAFGANVVVGVRRAVTGEETVALIEKEGGKAVFVEGDVAKAEGVQRYVDTALSKFGGLDVVIHNAASGLSSKPILLKDVDDANWDDQSTIALDGAYHLARASYAALKASGRGKYLLMTSSQALHGASRNPPYTTIKSAQKGFVKALAHEWGPEGITVNGIAPAALSPPAKAYMASSPQMREQVLAQFALRKIGDPRDDTGLAIAAFCADAFSYVTGQILCVDGGSYTLL